MTDALTFAALAGVAALARWLWHAKWHPLGRCRWCGGTGKNHGSTSARYGRCRHCTAGRRVRVGAKIFHPELRSKK